MPHPTRLSSARIKKLTSSQVSALAAVVLILFSIINFSAMSMTNCCDPASDSNCATTPATRGRRRPPQQQHQILSNSSKSAFGTLESTLLFLFDSIQSPTRTSTDADDTGEQHNLNMKTITNVYHRSLHVDKEDITLITHGSIEKFSQVLDQASRWQGPVTFVVYLNNKHDISDFCNNYMKKKMTRDFKTYVSVHVLLENAAHNDDNTALPSNVLRNIAHRNIESNFFLLMAVDSIPSPGMYNYLKESLDLEKLAKKNTGSGYFWAKLRDNTIFVLPAFERLSANKDEVVTLDLVPTTKKQLQDQLDKKEAGTADFPLPGHSPTNYYRRWLEPNAKNQFAFPIQYSKHFEPLCVVAYKRGIPTFWAGGSSAETWFWELNLSGYQFETMQDHFVVHRGRRTDGSELKGSQQLQHFMQYIRRKYGVDQAQLRDWTHASR